VAEKPGDRHRLSGKTLLISQRQASVPAIESAPAALRSNLFVMPLRTGSRLAKKGLSSKIISVRFGQKGSVGIGVYVWPVRIEGGSKVTVSYEAPPNVNMAIVRASVNVFNLSVERRAVGRASENRLFGDL